MKKIIPYLIIAVLAVVLFFSLRGCVKREIREHTIIQAAEQAPDSGRIWKDKYDMEHRRSQSLEGSLSIMKVAKAALLDSVATLNKIRVKDIQQITWLATQLNDHINVPVVNTRTATGTDITFNHKEHWYQLSGVGSISNDSLSDLGIDLHVTDSILLTSMRKPIGWFRKGSFVDATSANPKVRIIGLHSITIRDLPKPWGIGFQLGVRYELQDPNDPEKKARVRPYIGVGVSYNLIRFRL